MAISPRCRTVKSNMLPGSYNGLARLQSRPHLRPFNFAVVNTVLRYLVYYKHGDSDRDIGSANVVLTPHNIESPLILNRMH